MRKKFVLPNWCGSVWANLKTTFERYRLHFYICFICAGTGLLIAITKSYSDFSECSNFLYAISTQDFSPVSDLIWIGFFTTIFFTLVFFASIRFFIFIILGYGGIIVGTFYFFRLAFIAISVNALFGLLYLILFILPVFIFNFIMIILALCKIYDICGFAHNKRCMTNLSSHGKLIYRSIKNYWLYCLLFNYALWTLLVLIFILIF